MLILTILHGPDKGKRFELPAHEPQQIGRSSESLPLTDHTISRRHAELTPDDGHWYINDLHSANGTFVNGRQVSKRTLLKPGDQIRTGNTLFLFGEEAETAMRRRVRVAPDGEIDSVVEHTALANDESMIMAVSEPSQAAVTQLRIIYELTALIASIADRRELLERIMDLIFEHFEADRGFMLLQESPDAKPVPAVVRHRLIPEAAEDMRITAPRTIVQHVIHKGEGVLSSNAMTDQRFAGGDSVQQIGVRSALCVPMKFKDQIFGVIYLDCQIANYTFTPDQLKLATAIGVHTGLALANARLYAEQLKAERLAAVGQTVASLSHSIKNILQGLRGGADLVEMGFRKNNESAVRNGWSIVQRNLDRIYELTMNMLAYSKQRKPELEMANLRQILKDVAGLVQQQYDAKEVALICDAEADMPPVPLDAGGIYQAVLNLLNNALDAVPEKTGVVSLRCEYDPQRQVARIRVIDNGTGIAPANRKRLFQPFYSTKGQRGTGLGLVVTRKVVQEHGGSIHIESRPGEGTSFTITLPTHVKGMNNPADTDGPAGGEQVNLGASI